MKAQQRGCAAAIRLVIGLCLSAGVFAGGVNNIVVTSSANLSYTVDYASRRIELTYNGQSPGQWCVFAFNNQSSRTRDWLTNGTACRASVPLSRLTTVDDGGAAGYSVTVSKTDPGDKYRGISAWLSFKGYP